MNALQYKIIAASEADVGMCRPNETFTISMSPHKGAIIVEARHSHTIAAFSALEINTMVTFRLPERHYMYILGHESLLHEYGVMVNPGIIDRDYTGAIKIIVRNPSDTERTIPAGTQFANLYVLALSTDLYNEKLLKEKF